MSSHSIDDRNKLAARILSRFPGLNIDKATFGKIKGMAAKKAFQEREARRRDAVTRELESLWLGKDKP